MKYQRSIADDQAAFLPSPNYAEYKFDATGIPMKYYGEELGWQYEPIIPIYYANHYLQKYRETRDDAYRCRLEVMLEWLETQLQVLNGNGRGGLSLYSYYDYLPYVKSPWICGMNNGRLVELYLDVYSAFNDERFLNLADDLVSGLMIPIEDGGIRHGFPDGSVLYEEFGTLRPLLWSLNGHCSVIRSLLKYRTFRSDTWLDDELHRATTSVVRDIHLFDVPEGEGGSKVKLYGSAMLRFRPGALNNQSIAIDSILVRYPADPPLRIELGASEGHKQAGWSLYETGTSRFASREWLSGRLGRKVRQGVINFGMTDNFAEDDNIDFEIDFLPESKGSTVVEFYPDRNRRYVELGLLAGTPGQWCRASLRLSCTHLRRCFGNVVQAAHGYHAMNTDYVEMLVPRDPTGVLQRMAERWRARIRNVKG